MSRIRKISQVPIVFISSANENMNIVLAMNMGGDDFITKPYDLKRRHGKDSGGSAAHLFVFGASWKFV